MENKNIVTRILGYLKPQRSAEEAAALTYIVGLQGPLKQQVTTYGFTREESWPEYKELKWYFNQKPLEEPRKDADRAKIRMTVDEENLSSLNQIPFPAKIGINTDNAIRQYGQYIVFVYAPVDKLRNWTEANHPIYAELITGLGYDWESDANSKTEIPINRGLNRGRK